MIPVIAMTAVMTRTRRLQPRYCPKKLLKAIRVRRYHRVRCAVPLTFLVFINVLAGGNAQEVAKQVVQIPKKSTTNTDKAIKDKGKDSESDSSDPDSSDSDSSSKSPVEDSSDAESSSSDPGSSSSSDSSDEDEANVNEKVPPNKTKTTEVKSTSTSESSSGSEDDLDSESQQEEDTHVAKKRKTSEGEAAVTTRSQQIAKASQGKEKPSRSVKERFQRVKVQNLTPQLYLNNGYEARVGHELSPASGTFTTVAGRGDERLW